MNNDIKLKNNQIVLFFSKNLECNVLELASNIYNAIPTIGQPNIISLPNDVPTEISIQAPRIIFSNAKDMNLTVYATNLSINFMGQISKEEIKEYINKIYVALEDKNVLIQSIGIVSDYINFDTNFDLLKKKYYKDELSSGEIINSSWFIKKGNQNIWKYIEVTEENSKKILNIRIDTNNRGNDKIMSQQDITNFMIDAIVIADGFRKKIENDLGEE